MKRCFARQCILQTNPLKLINYKPEAPGPVSSVAMTILDFSNLHIIK